MPEDARRGDAQRDDALAARVDALSPKRLLALTGVFILALGFVFAGRIEDEANARRTETALRVDNAAALCVDRLNVAIMTGDSARAALVGCTPGGVAAAYHLSASGDVIAAAGATRAIDLAPAVARGLSLGTFASDTIDLPTGPARATWRPLENGDAVLVAAPARDIFQRTPVWAPYALLLGSIGLVCASLMLAFIRQSRSAAAAASAVGALGRTQDALGAGRAAPWHYDGKDRAVTFARSFLEPLGLGARDRRFTMREISALVHPQDLRAALAILTGDTSGVTEGVIRLRDPAGGWSRAFLRTAPDATRFSRSGVAVEISDARPFSPSAAIAESRLKDAIESIPEAFVLWDAQGRLAAWNKRFASIARGPRALAPGMTAAEIAEDSGPAGDIVAQYFSPDGALDEQSVEVELPKDRWLHISRRRTAEGGLVCVASNITDLKRRARAQKKKERELEALVQDLENSRRELSQTMRDYEFEKLRAEDASRSKSEFLANMSHELRTPLNAINGFSEIMKSELYGPVGDPKYKEYVDDILASGQHLLELIEDILDMSKIEAGRMTVEPRRVEIEKLLQECGRLVAKRAKDSGVALTVSVGHAPAVWADPRALKQVALNLLANAVKFTPEGGEVTLTCEADLDCVTIIVADNGVGIAKENLSRLGAPFELVEDHFAKSRRGSGLGLALSKSLMELQGGILALASQPGKGTVACASFPRRKDARARLPGFVRGEAHVLTDANAAAAAPAAAPRETSRRAAPEAAE